MSNDETIPPVDAPPTSRRSRSKWALAAGLFTFVVLGAGLAVAAVPNGNIFNACRNKTTFAIRVIDPSLAQKCTTAETAISWKTWKWRGAWSSASSYVIGDAVSYVGQSYTAIANSVNKPPAANPTLWNLLAAKGAPGAPGVVTGLGTGTNLATMGSAGGTCTVSEIQLIAGKSFPTGTLVANGQIEPISSFTALFNLIGTTYGGNGSTTFALPNLTKVAPNHMTYVICVLGLFP